MSTPADEPLYSGLPMELNELSPEATLPYPLPDGAIVVTIEQARKTLPEAQNVLMVLQAMSDEAPPDNEFKEEDEVVEGPKGLKHGYSIVRKPVNGDVSRL